MMRVGLYSPQRVGSKEGERGRDRRRETERQRETEKRDLGQDTALKNVLHLTHSYLSPMS